MIHTKYLDLVTGLKKNFSKSWKNKLKNLNSFKLPLLTFILIKGQIFL